MLGTNRDYKTMGRKVNLSLKYHAQRMEELVASGLDLAAASKKAFSEVRALGNKGLARLAKDGKL